MVPLTGCTGLSLSAPKLISGTLSCLERAVSLIRSAFYFPTISEFNNNDLASFLISISNGTHAPRLLPDSNRLVAAIVGLAASSEGGWFEARIGLAEACIDLPGLLVEQAAALQIAVDE